MGAIKESLTERKRSVDVLSEIYLSARRSPRTWRDHIRCTSARLLMCVSCVASGLIAMPASAVSTACVGDGNQLPAPFKDWWQRLGGNDGYLGCPTSPVLSTPDVQEVRFKDGLVQVRANEQPKLIVLAARGEGLFVFADLPPPVGGLYAVNARNALTNALAATAYLEPSIPMQLTLPPHNAPYRIRLAHCGFFEVLPCQNEIGATVEVSFSPYQIELTGDLDQRRKTVQRFFACRFEVFEWDANANRHKHLAGENQVLALLAKLSDADHACPYHAKNIDDALEALRKAESVVGVGTHADPVTIPVIDVDLCGRDGDYDAALWGIVRVLYKFKQQLLAAPAGNPNAPYNRNLHERVLWELASPHGGGLRGTWTEPPDKCGLRFPETENHILLIESSRYLINELLMQSPGALPHPEYDNRANGLPEWLRRHLQLFILRDFYETNSVPYQRYTAYALHNLADLAPDSAIKEGARIVLDYLTAKFAVQSNELRRLTPYRRQPHADIVKPTWFFGPRVDAMASRIAFLTGFVDRINDASEPKERDDDRKHPRFAHAHVASAASMVLASLSDYRPPDPVLELIRAPYAHDALQVFNLWEANRDVNHFEFSNEGIQITYPTFPFLLTAGGIPHGYGRDKNDLALQIGARSDNPLALPFSIAVTADIVEEKGKDNYGMVRATSLIPTLGGRRPHSLIAFHGADQYMYRRNSCVAPNFLCGLNLSLPPKLIKAGACPRVALPTSVERMWSANGGAAGAFGCPVGKSGEPDVPTFIFERGMILLWRQQGGATGTLGAWVEYDGKNPQSDRIQIRFEGFPSSFTFHLWPKKDGAWIYQHGVTEEGWDGATTGYTGGFVTFDPNSSPGSGRWDFEIEGCPADPFNQPCLVRSPTISVRYEKIEDPVEEAPLACDARVAELRSGHSALLLDVNAGCEPSRFGFWVAVIQDRCFRAPCADNGSSYGLVEAVPAGKYPSFDEYEADFRRRNGVRSYAFENPANEHMLPSGQTIKFHYFPQAHTTWAISASSDPALNALAAKDMTAWPRASGPIIDNDGAGNVTIKHPRTNQRIQFDWTNVSEPRR